MRSLALGLRVKDVVVFKKNLFTETGHQSRLQAPTKRLRTRMCVWKSAPSDLASDTSLTRLSYPAPARLVQ